MVHKICAIFDVKVAAYGTPLFFRTRGEAIRSWTDAVANKESQFHVHPEDFTMLELGEFDDQSGQFNVYKVAEPIGNALQLLSQKKSLSVEEVSK